MAIQFQPVEIADDRLFGVKLIGTVGRSDKDRGVLAVADAPDAEGRGR